MRYFKGNLHMHTTRSDGRRSPEEAIDIYRREGYDFLALTDHYVFGEPKNDGGMLIISGAEYDTGNDAGWGIWHVVGLNMARDPGLSREPQKPPVQELIDRIREAGGMAVLAHPAWSLNRVEEIEKLEGVEAIEIYNTFSGKPFSSRPDSSETVEQLALRGRYFNLTAVDDAHFYLGEQCRSFVMVRCEELTADNVIAALRAGDYYSSQGPTLEYSLEETDEGAVVKVSCSPVSSVLFVSNALYDHERWICGEGITEAVYHVKANDRFVRVELCDADGRRAWSNFIPLNRDRS